MDEEETNTNNSVEHSMMITTVQGLHDVDVDITITEASSSLPMSNCQQHRGPMGTAYAG